MSVTEPAYRYTFNANADNLDSFYKSGKTMRLVWLDGVSGGASAHGLSPDILWKDTDKNFVALYKQAYNAVCIPPIRAPS